MENAYLIHAQVKNSQHFAKSHPKPFSLEDLQMPFFILIIGYTTSFVVFLIEKFVASPDKYRKIIAYLCPVQSLKKHFQSQRSKCQKNRQRLNWVNK